MSLTKAPATMTSREIAELVCKRHDNVKRTIETLAESGVIVRPQIEDEHGTDAMGRARTMQVFRFAGDQGKRDSIVVVAQLSPEFTARLVDRWQELEAKCAQPALRIPQSLPEALRLAADLADENEVLTAQVREQAPKVVALQRISDACGTMCLTDAAKHLGMRRKDLLAWMRENRWIYRREGCAHWVAYQPRLASGYLEHKVTVIGVDEIGDQRLASRVRVTPRGLTHLAMKLGKAS
ncbi:phage antirepressor KilAC domain-containing protein [Pseudomonas kuykendallii]|uniref:phage antirepressor KilAC domain-containing protein n=1 Tax=Pseudomonas kuykendallii TaxID=1007099 RepID=UPI0028D33165|nr:phage antirepressor KilAC domain-containing protein [Pseudomonas kuykendallii]